MEELSTEGDAAIEPESAGQDGPGKPEATPTAEPVGSGGAISDVPGADAPDAVADGHNDGSVERALRLLEEADPAAYHKSISGLLRTGPGALLQPMPYSAARPYHHPSCVVVEPDQTGIETVELYCHAAYPEFDQHLARPFDAPELDHLIANVYHGLVYEGINIALVTNHGQLHDIALVLSALSLGVVLVSNRLGRPSIA